MIPNLLTAEDIAAKLKYSARYVRDKLSYEPGFPERWRGRPRWLESEIEEWMMKPKVRLPKAPKRAPRP